MSEEVGSANSVDAVIAHLDKAYNEKPMVYRDEADGRIVIRNSKIGTCPRELWAAWKGMEPAKEQTFRASEEESDDINSDPAAEGHVHEAHVKKLLEDKGWKLSGFEHEFVLLIGDCKVVGHADMGSAICPRTGIDYFGEVKSMGKQNFLDFLDDGWDLFPTYPVQLSVGMIATGKPGIVWVKCRDNGRILPPFIFTEPPVSRVEIMRKVLQIKAAVDSDIMPQCGLWRKTNSWCRYTQLHDEQDLVPADQVEVPELERVLRLYKKLGSTTQVFIDPDTKQPVKNAKDKLYTETAYRAELRKQIDAKLKDLNTSSIKAGEFRAVQSVGGVGFDEEEFKLAHPELWLKFKTKQKNGQLRVVEIGKEDKSEDG